MIKNERQYLITKAQAARFRQTLNVLRRRTDEASDVHPRIAQAQEDAVDSQLADLERELREYEALKAGDFPLEELNVIGGIATTLIKARIAQGLSHRELAQRVGIKEQQIQRYEATNYEAANLSRLQAVASALRANNGDD